ncbi:hypothetical protein DI270_002200 [Microbispora triticiradicis]|uniref:Cell wall-active antibiotics response LiaF-like C-terminal domain-containing protein n=3 Tax=Microbispora TaxID=2005 RepID=A0ABY3LUL2_9ACTN|nr:MULTISPECIES: hypothetical protein [Microbispora]RGA06635.1 hypothetical protein DI270_002200 [Microbispora triticiradicis]TLP60557.1 hypothetical protein FED44_11585 [Microbispora fusca]TYB54845.1 hypothetical protein FXF59_21975 [Microbispora tritici]
MTNTNSSQRTDWHVSLLGGLRHRGQGRMPADTVVLTPVGGADLDLGDAEMAPVTTVTKVSLVGGVRLRVPADAAVEVEGFSLFGGRAVDPATAGASGPLVRVRSYGVFGGVKVTRA